MTARPLVGIALCPDRAFLAHHRHLIEDDAEVFEVMPESLWDENAEPSASWQLFREIRARSGRPFVAHGTLFSIGAAAPPPRRARWLDALRRDRDAFEFLWFSDHLGFADCGDLHVALPLPLPPTPAAADVCAAALDELQSVFPLVAIENNVGYCRLGDPLDEPGWFGEVCARSGAGLVLDLHNAFTVCRNFELDLREWLDRVDCARVVEIHVSGGSDSDPDWLPSRRVCRLDSHDGRVPEPVWQALDSVLPRCPALRAVILEQVPNEIDERRARGFAADFRRARAAVRAQPARGTSSIPARSIAGARSAPEEEVEALAGLQRALAGACLAADPPAALARALDAPDLDPQARQLLAAVDDDGLRLTGLLVQKLRFERSTRGDADAFAAFERDPEGFVRRWQAFAHGTPPAVFPAAEARAFAAGAGRR